MPIKRVQFPDGSIKRVEVPEGATNEQILQFVQSQYDDPQKRETDRVVKLFAEMREDDKAVAAAASPVENWLTGAFQGLKEPVQAVQQMAAETGLGPQRWAQEVAEDREQWDRHMGESEAAWNGKLTGGLIATLPLSAVRVLGAGYKGALATGAMQGGLSGLLTPVDAAGDFLKQKMAQVGTGAAVGGAIGGVGKGLIDAGTAAVNAPRKLANLIFDAQPPAQPQQASTLQRIVTGTPAGLRRGDRVAKDAGINLSPGERSNSGALKMLENIARQSVWTRDRMAAGDLVRSRQMNNAIRSTARDLTPTKTSPEQFATDLQGTIRQAVDGVARSRSATARADYGAVEQAAGGAPVVQTTATLDAIAKIADKYRGTLGHDATAIARQAEDWFNGLSGDGAISAQRALNQLQAWEDAARSGTGLFEGVQNRTAATSAARELAAALRADLDNAATSTGGTVGELLRKANANWAKASQQIDTMEASVLGRVVGEEFQDTVAGVSFNKVSPEALWKRLDNASASELEALKQYVGRMNPDLWAQYQRLTLERARDAARATAPSRGQRTLGIDPGAFVKSLEGSSGQRAVDAQKRMRVIFGDNARLDAILDAGRRMADTTGKNFSNSAPTQEVLQIPGVLGKVTEGARAAAGVVGPLYGLRTVAAKASMPANQRRIPLASAPPWMRRLPNYGAPIAGGAAAAGLPDGVGFVDMETGEALTEEDIRRARRY